MKRLEIDYPKVLVDDETLEFNGCAGEVREIIEETDGDRKFKILLSNGEWVTLKRTQFILTIFVEDPRRYRFKIGYDLENGKVQYITPPDLNITPIDIENKDPEINENYFREKIINELGVPEEYLKYDSVSKVNTGAVKDDPYTIEELQVNLLMALGVPEELIKSEEGQALMNNYYPTFLRELKERFFSIMKK